MLQNTTDASSKTNISQIIDTKIIIKPKSKLSNSKGRKRRINNKMYLYQLHEYCAQYAAESSDPEICYCLCLKPLIRYLPPCLPADTPSPVDWSTQSWWSSIAATDTNIYTTAIYLCAVSSVSPSLDLYACAMAQVVHEVVKKWYLFPSIRQAQQPKRPILPTSWM